MTKELFVSLDELEKLEIDYTLEDNGMSGKYIGYHWYTGVSEDGNTI